MSRRIRPPYPEDVVIELPQRHRTDYRRQVRRDVFLVNILLAASLVAALATLGFVFAQR